MNPLAEMEQDLRQYLTIYEDIQALVEREGQALRNADNSAAFGIYQTKKELLPRLNQSLDKLRQYRLSWQKLSPEERTGYPEISNLLRQCQDLIMKIIVLDRENEQTLLRRGLIPAQHLPSVNQQRPHFVANLYRRGSNH